MLGNPALPPRGDAAVAYWWRRLAGGVLGLILLVLTGVVRARPRNLLDQWVNARAHRLGQEHPVLVSVSRAVTAGGASPALIAVVVTAFVLLLLRRRGGDAALLVGAAVVSSLIVRLAKVWVARPRPHFTDAFVGASGFAFPSGHVTNAATVYGLVVVLLWPELRGPARWKWWGRRLLVAGLGALVLAIALSRVLLGVHWASDVVAGLALGLLLVLGAIAVRPQRPPDHPG